METTNMCLFVANTDMETEVAEHINIGKKCTFVFNKCLIKNDRH